MKRYLIVFIVSLFLFFGNVLALSKAPIDITTASIEDLMSAMEKGYVDSETLVNIYLERIDKYDDMFNSINQINEHAVEQARTLDKEREEGKIRGRLHGIPILVKCNIDAYGIPTTAGTKALVDNYPKDNAFAVQKLVDEGAIVLGSTNMSELAFSAANSYSSFGYVRNVFNVKGTPYGSSGGAAVAVKAGFAAASLGTDTNSSVRLPASGAGLVGMRPTLGLVSRTGVIPYDIERDTVGVLTRTVSDNALLLDIISGIDKDDKYTKDSKGFDYDLSNTSLSEVTIGVPTQYLKGSEGSSGVLGLTDTDIYNLTSNSIKKLEEAGATIIYLDDFVKSSNISIASSTYAGRTMCDNFNVYIKGTTGTIRSFEELVATGKYVQNIKGYMNSCGEYEYGKNTRDKKKATYRDYVDNYMKNKEIDVILYPSLKNKVFGYNKYGNISPGSSFGSVIGYPSITVPMGMIGDYSYGIEFLSKAYNEELLYKVSYEFEKVNENKVDVSPLTPALYEVPESVVKLKGYYEEALNNNSPVGKVSEWRNKVAKYFDDYNTLEDVDGKAEVLCSEYLEVTKINLDVIKDVFKEDSKVMDYIGIGLLIVVGFIIIKEFSKCFR